MQLSTVPFIMTHFIIVILLLHDHVVDIVFVAKPSCIIFHTCQLHDHAKQYDNECSSHVYDDDGSCMAIYLGMAMEMP